MDTNNVYFCFICCACMDYGFNNLLIDKINAYTHAQNGASNHILQKVGMNFMEDYPDKDGIIWKWWQLEKSAQ